MVVIFLRGKRFRQEGCDEYFTLLSASARVIALPMFVLLSIPFGQFISAFQSQTSIKRNLIYSTLTLEVQCFDKGFITLPLIPLKFTFEHLGCPVPQNLYYDKPHCRVLELVNLYQRFSASTLQLQNRSTGVCILYN